MGTVVLHAGMHKTGSSSIQRWLRDNALRLRGRGIVPLNAQVDQSGALHLAENDGSATMNSWQVMAHCEAHPGDRAKIAAALAEELDRKAEGEGIVILSAESFDLWFTKPEPDFLAALAGLSQRHELRIACYVRPQHSSLEAAWRANGFRSTRPPSEFLRIRCRRRDYLRVLRQVGEAAPALAFAPRPFRRDLLVEGDVVTDFARAFLDLEKSEGEGDGIWRNPSLPLELVNALRGAPALAAVASGHGRANPLPPLKRLAERIDVAESERVRRSRLVLQQVCHELFEDGNRKLISELGWPTDEWVPAVEEEIGEASFERLDELWEPDASPAELAILHAAVGRLVAGSRRSGARARTG